MISVLSATPQMPTDFASTTERTTFAAPAATRARAISRCRAAGDQELGDEIERLVHEQDEREQRQHGRALAVALADPALDQQVGNEQERQREHDRGGRPATQAGEQQSPLPLLLARALVLRERRVEEAGPDAAQPEGEREELRRDRVERSRLGAEHDPDDDDVGREDDLVGDVDEEVAPAERDELADALPRDEGATEPRSGSSRRSQRSGRTRRSNVVPSVSAPSRIRPPPFGHQDGDEHA